MANRQEVLQKRTRLSSELRAACRDGSWSPGDLVPSQAELSKTYGLSAAVVHEELRKLIDEGVMYAVPRVGTFVGTPRSSEVDVYLLIFPWRNDAQTYLTQIYLGFEERMAQLGGVSLMLTKAEAEELHDNRELPNIKGLFELDSLALSRPFKMLNVPKLGFGNLQELQPEADAIHFDDIDGGAQATRHLLAAGHQKIAFLGLHSQKDERGIWQWSADREIGWRRVMLDNGGDTNLSFRASGIENMGGPAQRAAALEAAKVLVTNNEIEAVVAANHFAVEALFDALKHANLPAEKWPSVVGFDDDPRIPGAVVSYLRLPWDQIGRSAAELLHGRANGKIEGTSLLRLVPMRLIPRLSCREQWTSTPGLARRLTSGNIVTNHSSAIRPQQLIRV